MDCTYCQKQLKAVIIGNSRRRLLVLDMFGLQGEFSFWFGYLHWALPFSFLRSMELSLKKRTKKKDSSSLREGDFH